MGRTIETSISGKLFFAPCVAQYEETIVERQVKKGEGTSDENV
jgi:hypothetical protein